MIIPDVVLIQLSYWGWAQICWKHVDDSNKHIIEEIVRQVGYLPELTLEVQTAVIMTPRRKVKTDGKWNEDKTEGQIKL